mgnify:CR=1 FL=1
MVISGAVLAAMLMNQPGFVPSKLYRFKQGDTLAKVAQLNATGYEKLMAANPDMNPSKIRPGMVVVIPARIPKEVAKKLQSSAKPAGIQKTRSYAIRNGDTDWSVSARVGITPKALRLMNPGTNWKKLQLGQEIQIPNSVDKAVAYKKPASLASAKTTKHVAVSTATVREGDNDWIIAARFGMKPSELRALNPGTDWRKIKPGQKLQVRGGSSSSLVASKGGSSKPGVIHSKRVAVSRDSVNVRAGGRTNSKVVARAEKGELGSVVDRIGDWYKVKLGSGKAGWVRGDMLSAVKASDIAAPAPLAKSEAGKSKLASNSPVGRRGTKIVVNRDNVNVRTGGKTASRVRTTVAQGTAATVLGTQGEWIKVKFSTGLTGYIRSDMVKRSPSSSTTLARNTAPRQPSAVQSRPSKSGSKTVATRLPAVPKSSGSSRTRSSSSSKNLASLSPRASSSLLATAGSMMGTRYRWGGTSRSGVDCSGFTSVTFKKHGVTLPRTSIAQSKTGKAVSKDSLKPGDLVFFKTRGNRVSHVGIYQGNGKFIHASSGKGRVTVNSLNDGYYSNRYAGARRVTGVKGAPSRSSSASSRGSGSSRIEAAKAADRDAMKKAESQLSESPAPKPEPEAAAPTTRVQPGTDVTGP